MISRTVIGDWKVPIISEKFTQKQNAVVRVEAHLYEHYPWWKCDLGWYLEFSLRLERCPHRLYGVGGGDGFTKEFHSNVVVGRTKLEKILRCLVGGSGIPWTVHIILVECWILKRKRKTIYSLENDSGMDGMGTLSSEVSGCHSQFRPTLVLEPSTKIGHRINRLCCYSREFNGVSILLGPAFCYWWFLWSGTCGRLLKVFLEDLHERLGDRILQLPGQEP